MVGLQIARSHRVMAEEVEVRTVVTRCPAKAEDGVQVRTTVTGLSATVVQTVGTVLSRVTLRPSGKT